jgi:hypothetical protein
MYLLRILAQSRKEAIHDARALVESQRTIATGKSELITNLRKIFYSVQYCSELGRNPFERSYYMVVCEQIEYHITMIAEDRTNAA